MKCKMVVSALALAAGLNAGAAMAQGNVAPVAAGAEAARDDGTIGEIIVTAQKRSERINSVPLAISAVSSDQLAARGIADTAQLSKVIPSFNVLKSAYGQPVFYIRGIGFADVTVSISPAVSIYVDEVALPYATMARGAAFDLSRVEVLKGPQGTLFGQNSTGGAVNYIAAKPTSTVTAGVDLEVGNYNTVNASAFVSGPLSKTLKARVAVQERYQGDWQRSLSRPGDTRGQQRLLNGRAMLDWTPTDTLKFELTGSAWHDTSDTQAPQFVLFAPARTGPAANQNTIAALSSKTAAPNTARESDWDANSRTARNDNFYQTTLRGDLDLGFANLTSISAYSDASVESPVDLDGTNFRNAYYIQYAKLKTFSQELRLDGSLAGGTNWMVGGNYQYAKTNELLDEFINPTNNVVGPFVYDHVKASDNQVVNTYAGFASLDHKLTDSITLRASGRYTSEKRRFDGCLADAGEGVFARAFSLVGSGLAGRAVTIAPGSCVTFDDVTKLPLPTVRKNLNESNFSWRAGVDWKPTGDVLVYANVAKGYKSGGFTAVPAVFASQLAPVTQESVLTYEGGLKAGLFARRVQLNLSGFYYDYKNKQLQGYVNILPFGALPTLVNIPTSRVYGAEAELTARVTENLRLQLSGAYLDTKATSAPAVAIGPLGGTYNFSGESFPNTPKYQATADVEQRIPLDASTEAYVGGSMQYRSSASGVFGVTQNAQTRSVFTIDAYTLFDLRAGVRLNDGKLAVEVWGRNVTNKFYVTGVTRTVDTVSRYTGMPATFGARVSWKY